ncbi:MAG: PEP-CTERM sorting domain-containing protein [Phycisphaeraceae bacterium]|nr:PEP-CTERM sorting domain-containing protein [Phycisphaeraceae bacterium]
MSLSFATGREFRHLAVGVVGLGLLWATPAAQGSILQIQMGGVNLAYDGSTVATENPITLNPVDSLTNATFLLNEVEVGVVTTGVTLDMFVPDVFNIPVGTSTIVNSSPGGTLMLDLGSGDFLSLDLDEASVAYIPLTATVEFVFAGAAAEIVGQQLPFGLTIADPVSISFSTQVTSVTDDGTFITSFKSAGTGEIVGVPEPASLALMMLGSAALLRRKR